jgi:hypothetical protein
VTDNRANKRPSPFWSGFLSGLGFQAAKMFPTLLKGLVAVLALVALASVAASFPWLLLAVPAALLFLGKSGVSAGWGGRLAGFLAEHWPAAAGVCAAAAVYDRWGAYLNGLGMPPLVGVPLLFLLPSALAGAGFAYDAARRQRLPGAQARAAASASSVVGEILSGAEGGRAPGGAPRPLADVWREVDSLVGLAPVKQKLREIVALVEADRRRREQGLPPLVQTFHMAFLGNPGTGKTTVARLVGELFASLGVLPSGHLVETDRSGLVAGYVGQTALKVKEKVRQAAGGVLFIDEAYSLARGGDRDFGAEALDALVKAMEDNRSNLVVILAGYTDEMRELFRLNPGLGSRVAFTLEFPDYAPEELVRIAAAYALKRGWRLGPGAEGRLLARFRREASLIGRLGNGRHARNVVEEAERKAALRIARGMGEPDVLLAEDFA